MVTSSYEDLTAWIEKLTKQADAARSKEMQTVIGQIHAIMAEYGITGANLEASRPVARNEKAPQSLPSFRIRKRVRLGPVAVECRPGSRVRIARSTWSKARRGAGQRLTTKIGFVPN